MDKSLALGTSVQISQRSSASSRPGLGAHPGVWLSCVEGVSGLRPLLRLQRLFRSRHLKNFRVVRLRLFRTDHGLLWLYCRAPFPFGMTWLQLDLQRLTPKKDGKLCSRRLLLPVFENLVGIVLLLQLV